MWGWLARNFWMVLTGLLLTASAMLLHLGGYTEPLELFAYDLQVKHLSRVPASDAIVHIDIDDDALQRVGSWPWPRDVQADVIRTLSELQAGQIVTDLLYNEPRPLSLSGYRDADAPPVLDPEELAADLVWPDDELADAVAGARNVYLAIYYQETVQPAARSPLAGQIADALEVDFSLNAAALAERLSVDPRQIEAVLAGVKRQIAQQRVAAILREDPDATAAQVHAKLLHTPFARFTADRRDVQAAYQHERNLRSLHDKLPPVPTALAGKLPSIHSVHLERDGASNQPAGVREIMPPLEQLTRAGRGVGFVTFAPDGDGLTRRICPLLEWDGRLVLQLGFAAVCDRLNIRPEDLSIQNGHLHIAAGPSRAAMRIQLDEQGRMLLSWHVSAEGWHKSFTHLPVTQLLTISECRRRSIHNARTKAALGAEIIRIVQGEQGYAAHVEKVRAVARARQQLIAERHQRGGAQGEYTPKEVDGRQARIEAEVREVVEFARQQWSELNAPTSQGDPVLADELQRFAPVAELLERIDQLDQANVQLEYQKQQRIDQLKPFIAGKTCLLGYTATALADMITTPAYHRVPGVLVHANVANSVIQNRFQSWTALALESLFIAVIGGAVTLAMIGLHPRTALLACLVPATLLQSANALVIFSHWNWWFATLTGVTTGFVLWAALTLLRFLTTDRQRKAFGQAIAQYVSPAMARHMAENATTLDLTPVSRDVTCFFSDIVGFTTLTERLGPAGTQAVLNPYLQAMSAALHSRQALINKFIGDGIFAFFNPPILPYAEHASAACEAALDCVAELTRLPKKCSDSSVAEEFGKLGMRIGIATGEVFVGDYGSASKLDYTCIGDTVNLASRLESANRVFGSTIMLSGQTRLMAGDQYEYRYLGALRVKGRATAVDVYELLGYKDRVDAATLGFRTQFEQAVRLCQNGELDRAVAVFEHCLERRPGDPGTLLYRRAIGTWSANPRAGAWSAALELAEK